jgi:hypothetical protein
VSDRIVIAPQQTVRVGQIEPAERDEQMPFRQSSREDGQGSLVALLKTYIISLAASNSA